MVSNNRYIIDFVGPPSFLRFALQVVMATMHFHKVQTGVSFRNIFTYYVVHKKQFGVRKNLSLGC